MAAPLTRAKRPWLSFSIFSLPFRSSTVVSVQIARGTGAEAQRTNASA
jgi:hypothetical protein